MAVCEIWKIEKRLDVVIKYTTNEDKTENKELYNDLHNVIDYTKSDFKTEEQFFVSGINCNPESAYKEMVNTKKIFNKSDGILGFHAFQSFKENEVLPDVAHAIGIKLANEMWGDRFEVVVSTHINTNHIHNHFVINSVSFKDGKKYYDNYESYAELRHLSDSICREHGLSVLEEKKTKKGINYSNYYKSKISKCNYHTITKEDIDSAIKQAYSYYDFEKILSSMGYDLIYRANKLSVRREPYKKNIRLERSYGIDYTKENISKRIGIERATREAIPISKHQIKTKKNYKSNNSFYKLFTYYYWLLKVVPKKYPTIYVSPLIRADVKKMEKIGEETKLLVSKKINTYREFSLYRKKIDNEFNYLKEKKNKLWSCYKKENNSIQKEKILSSIKNINYLIEPIRKEINLCRDIEIRYIDIKNKLDKNEKEIEKERIDKYESR